MYLLPFALDFIFVLQLLPLYTCIVDFLCSSYKPSESICIKPRL